MGYGLGVDLGTTFTAAAVTWSVGPEMVTLGDRAVAAPSVVYVLADGSVLAGAAAARRGSDDGVRHAREFKRRFGDAVPLVLGGVPWSADRLTARLLAWVLERVTDTEGGPPESVVLTHPANWGPFKRELLVGAARQAGLDTVTLLSEPEAAAIHYASMERVESGSLIAVYDLGGGTFDAAVLQKHESGFHILGRPEGIERLGGIDFDEAVFQHVIDTIGDDLSRLDPTDPATTLVLERLRRDCVEAKEALSADTEAVIDVLLPNRHTQLRLTRSEFEAMIRPALADTLTALRRALLSAEVTPDELHRVLLTGGSSRIPVVAELVATDLGRPVAVDIHPKHAVALGAAIAARGSAPPSAPTVTPRKAPRRDPMLRAAVAAVVAAVVVAAVVVAGVVVLAADDGGEPGADDITPLAGRVVDVLGPFEQRAQENFEVALRPFEERTGIDVRYEGDDTVATVIDARLDTDDRPDVVVLPQPGKLADLFRAGDLQPLDDETAGLVRQSYDDAWLDLATVDGTLAGVWYRATVKSLVWYPTAAFLDGGYEVPGTWVELEALTERLMADDRVPWCLGVEGGDQTGWLATDWVEDLVLRMHGPEAYDRWVRHEIAFDDPLVLQALERFGAIVRRPGGVLGGPEGALSTHFTVAPSFMFGPVPECWLNRHDSTLTDFLPAGVDAGEEGGAGVFVLPPIGTDPPPLLVGGDVAAMVNDRPEVRELMRYLATPESGEGWAAEGGYHFPHAEADLSTLRPGSERDIGELLAEAEVIRFDGSDLMPSTVGTGTFWQAMRDFLGGDEAAAVLARVDESWPEGGN